MTYRTHTLAALAAACMFTGVALAQDPINVTGKTAEDPNRTVQNGQAEMKMDDMKSDMKGMKDNVMGKAGGNDEAATLRMFAADPQTACAKTFVYMAAMGNMNEVETAKLAQKKSENQKVKDLAGMIITDHQMAQEKLKPVAATLGVMMPTALPPAKQQMAQIFSSLPAEKFDKAYVMMLQADHAKDVTEYRGVSMNSDNEQVKAYATDVLPKLMEHSKHVDMVASSIGVQGGGM